MKKFISILLGVIVMLALFTSCGDSDSSGSSVKEQSNYQLYLDVTFDSNIIRNKYDVNILLDNEELGTIEHGEKFSHLVSEIDGGEHEILFKSREDPTVTGTTSIEVDRDMTFQCTIHAKSDEIKIDDEEITDGVSGAYEKMPDVVGMDLDEAEDELSDDGFTNLSTEPDSENSEIENESDWSVSGQNIKAGKKILKDEKVVLTCKSNVEDADDPVQENETTDKNAETTEPLTIENNSDFSALMSSANVSDETASSFASKYTGQSIKFDCYIADMVNHGTYKTRYDILLYGGSGDNDIHGPAFQFQDVSMANLNFQGDYPDTIGNGTRLNVTARVIGYDVNAGLMKLSPESTIVSVDQFYNN